MVSHFGATEVPAADDSVMKMSLYFLMAAA
jgi:hypothetical protein